MDEEQKKPNLAQSILNFTAKLQRLPKSGERHYGDITIRIFSLMVDLSILVLPLAVISHFIMIAVFGVADQYNITLAKVMEKRPELLYEPLQMLGYMAQTYPADFDIISRQFLLHKLLWITVYGVYNIFFIYRYGATPAKMLFGLKVIDNITNGKLSLSQSIIRYLGYFISFPFGLMWGGARNDKRCWHDFIADTVVIFDPNRWYKRKTEGVRGKIRKAMDWSPRKQEKKD